MTKTLPDAAGRNAMKPALAQLDEFAAAAPGRGALAARAGRKLREGLQGGAPAWLQVAAELPQVATGHQLQLDAPAITGAMPLAAAELRTRLMRLHPWRKGPFRFFDVLIDGEWRSDWKWRRLAPQLSSLAGRRLLDVGCGNGYHCFRARGAGAAEVVGVDPSQLYLAQFLVLRRQLPEPVYFLPLGDEELGGGDFDTVLSMGVLTHRRAPGRHLSALRRCLRSGGELALETLVTDGAGSGLLKPPGRYARMRNVWQLPSLAALEGWLGEAGFRHIRLADRTCTGVREQRSTDWMQFQSLQDFLHEDGGRTLEGHPRPTRALFIAEAP